MLYFLIKLHSVAVNNLKNRRNIKFMKKRVKNILIKNIFQDDLLNVSSCPSLQLSGQPQTKQNVDKGTILRKSCSIN